MAACNFLQINMPRKCQLFVKMWSLDAVRWEGADYTQACVNRRVWLLSPTFYRT